MRGFDLIRLIEVAGKLSKEVNEEVTKTKNRRAN